MRKKGIFAVLLSIVLLFQSTGWIGIQYVSAAEISDTEDGMVTVRQSFVNPMFPNEKESGQSEDQDTEDTSSVDATGVNTYSSLSSAAKYIRKQLKARSTTIQLEYTGSGLTQSKIAELSKNIFEKVFEVTSNPQEGDYLYYLLKSSSIGYSYWPGDTTRTKIIWTNLRYYTTASQESAVLSEVKTIISSLGLTKCSDVEKIKKIHDYLCKNTSYDYTYSRYTAYGALINKSAVCQGYATAFYALCVQAGVSVRCIPGSGNGQSHLWNIVKAGSKWYNIDTTWDDQPSTSTGIIYTYFLKNNSSFSGHVRNFGYYRNWTSAQITKFNSSYPMASSSYSGSVGRPTLKSVTSTGYNSVKMVWSRVNTSTGYAIYYAASANGTYKVIKTIRGGAVTSLNIKGLTPGQTYYFKVQAYSNMFSDVKGGYSSVIACKPLPSQVQFTKLTTKSKSITPTWKKVTGAVGYQISLSYTYKGKKYTRKISVLSAGTALSQSVKLTGLKSGAVCRVKIRAYAKGSTGGNVYGSYSKTKTITVK